MYIYIYRYYGISIVYLCLYIYIKIDEIIAVIIINFITILPPPLGIALLLLYKKKED